MYPAERFSANWNRKGLIAMKTKIWAHRGASAEAPENTMTAYRLAAEEKADGIELDVQLSHDGELVVIHDETLDRTTNGHGYVAEFSLKELRALRADRTIPLEDGERIPTLHEVLSFLKDTDLKLNIELKNSVVPYPGMEEKVLRTVEAAGLSDRVIYSSFNHESMVRIHEINPDAKCGLLYSDGFVNVPSYAKKLGMNAIHPDKVRALGTDLIEKGHEKGLKVNIWTVNDEKEMDTLIRAGADALITNVPKKARKVRKAIKKEAKVEKI